MSPILKRDIHEQLRQARRLAAVTGWTSHTDDENNSIYEPVPSPSGSHHGHNDLSALSPKKKAPDDPGIGIGTSSSRRLDVGSNTDDPISQKALRGDQTYGWDRTSPVKVIPNGSVAGRNDIKGKGKGKAALASISASAVDDDDGSILPRSRRSYEEERSDQDEEHPLDHEALLKGSKNSHRGIQGMPPLQMEYEETPGSRGRPMTPWRDLRNLLLESTPSLLLSLVGLVFTGELLEHLARWRVFRRVDELFILVPMLGNLKGNLEMCLSARLGTSANIGELDHRKTRKALLTANMFLLGLQALLIACLAAVISFVLGLITVHRLGDLPPSSGMNSTIPSVPLDPGLAVGEQDFHEGYTRPGWKQLVMVLATGMGAAGLSSAVLGSFMSNLIVVSRWAGLDPDNITPPVAACLGDLLTLFILALLGTALVGAMDTPIPLIAVIIMGIAAAEFTRRVMRNQWVKNVARGGWIPLIGAMLISSGTGMVLDSGVSKYRGFALLAISMTGLTGSIGAIHANRLSTHLHTRLHPSTLSTSTPSHNHNNKPPPTHLSALQASTTLYIMAFPCQAAFLWFVSWAGWIDLSLGLMGWGAFALTTGISLVLSHNLTMFFWSKDLDPDSYTLPIHSALVDFIGQLLLMLAYELCIAQGLDVMVREEP